MCTVAGQQRPKFGYLGVDLVLLLLESGNRGSYDFRRQLLWHVKCLYVMSTASSMVHRWRIIGGRKDYSILLKCSDIGPRRQPILLQSARLDFGHELPESPSPGAESL